MLDADHQQSFRRRGAIAPGDRIRRGVGALDVSGGGLHPVVHNAEDPRVVAHQDEGAPGVGPDEEAAPEELLRDAVEAQDVAPPDGLDGDVPEEDLRVPDRVPAGVRQEAVEDLGSLDLECGEPQGIGGADGLLVGVEEGDDLSLRVVVRADAPISCGENEGQRDDQDHSKTTRHGHSSGSDPEGTPGPCMIVQGGGGSKALRIWLLRRRNTRFMQLHRGWMHPEPGGGGRGDDPRQRSSSQGSESAEMMGSSGSEDLMEIDYFPLTCPVGLPTKYSVPKGVLH